jgi:RCC1 and BTB domain-containing protein
VYCDQSLSKWPVFSLLGDSFLHSLKMVCVFGASGSEAVMVTHDDQVYALGSNSNGCLGVGDLNASFQPRKIKELCNKGESL